jgi:hypothetical protein
MEELLNKIREKNTQKRIVSLCNMLEKKCSFKSGKDVENLSFLALWLYIYGNSKLALELCQTTYNVTFDQNFNVWAFMHFTWGLEARILRENGDLETSRKICETINRQWLTPNKIFNTPEKMHEFEMKRRARFIYEDVAQKKKIAFYESENKKDDANTYRLIALQSLILYSEIGVFPDFELHKQEVQSNITDYVFELAQTK